MKKELQHEISPLEQLTNLQAELGYVKGELSTVAMLGLIGEAGEVLAETQIDNLSIIRDLTVTVSACSRVEALKKKARSGELKVGFVPGPGKVGSFKAELADVFYYINILATNMGLTINDLAQMAHDKVRAKQASGGSSEDRK